MNATFFKWTKSGLLSILQSSNVTYLVDIFDFVDYKNKSL